MLYFFQVEQLLRAVHAVNRGAGVGAFVIIAECGPKEIGMYAGLLEQHDFEIELFYWKQMARSNSKGMPYGILITLMITLATIDDAEAHTLLKEVVSPFIVGTLDREFVRAHLAVDASQLNIKEGTREALLEEVVTTFSLEGDWIMEFDPPSCKFILLCMLRIACD